MSHVAKLLVATLLVVGGAQATDPASVQDPPGGVDVDQPAGVSLPERNTDQDTTDTLRGGRTEVIESAQAQPSESRADVGPGTEARAAYEEGAAPAPSGDTFTGAAEASVDDAAEPTFLGTDLGYGTGTETEAPPTPQR